MKHTAPSTVVAARRGFTLTEILVVVGIIVALAAIGLPMVLRAYKSGIKMRGQADLNSIATALNAYKQDFGDYPRVNQLDAGVPVENLGAAVLGKALIGTYGDGQIPPTSPGGPPTPDTTDPPTQSSLGSLVKVGHCVRDTPGWVALVDDAGSPTAGDKWAKFDGRDGFDGPGFRTRRGPGPNGIFGDDDDSFQGQSYGPYLQAEKFNVVGCMLRDSAGKPILYFPATVGKPNIRGQVQTPQGTRQGFVDRSEFSKYDANDNFVYFKRPGESDTDVLEAIRAAMGDLDKDGIIDSGETPATEDAFILWSAGPDGQYGINRTTTPWNPTRQDIERMDDVTSFTK